MAQCRNNTLAHLSCFMNLKQHEDGIVTEELDLITTPVIRTEYARGVNCRERRPTATTECLINYAMSIAQGARIQEKHMPRGNKTFPSLENTIL